MICYTKEDDLNSSLSISILKDIFSNIFTCHSIPTTFQDEGLKHLYILDNLSHNQDELDKIVNFSGTIKVFSTKYSELIYYVANKRNGKVEEFSSDINNVYKDKDVFIHKEQPLPKLIADYLFYKNEEIDNLEQWYRSFEPNGRFMDYYFAISKQYSHHGLFYSTDNIKYITNSINTTKAGLDKLILNDTKHLDNYNVLYVNNKQHSRYIHYILHSLPKEKYNIVFAGNLVYFTSANGTCLDIAKRYGGEGNDCRAYIKRNNLKDVELLKNWRKIHEIKY